MTLALSERVLWPAMGAEAAGMEDARFVRFVDDDGSVTFYATYTAYSGSHISQQLLETTDFRSFTSAPLVGRAAANKGLALFPRRIRRPLRRACRDPTANRTRSPSRTTCGVAERVPCQQPDSSVGGVAARQLRPADRDRRRMAGAHPRRRPDAHVLHRRDPARPRRPDTDPRPAPATAAQPCADEQDGYVPNVVYSCGALVHAETLVLPYGIADAAIGVATVPLAELLDAMTP